MTQDLSAEGLRSDMYANPHKETTRVVGSQDGPIMQGSGDATDRQKVAGILDQTRLDLSRGHHLTAHELLTERFKQSHVDVDSVRVAELALTLRDVDSELDRREEAERKAAEEAPTH